MSKFCYLYVSRPSRPTASMLKSPVRHPSLSFMSTSLRDIHPPTQRRKPLQQCRGFFRFGVADSYKRNSPPQLRARKLVPDAQLLMYEAPTNITMSPNTSYKQGVLGLFCVHFLSENDEKAFRKSNFLKGRSLSTIHVFCFNLMPFVHPCTS